MGLGADIAGSAANTAIGAGMGLLLGGHNDRRQIKQQQKLQDMQIKGQKDMAGFNKQLALDMWNETNYGAQRKHMEDAGLNVGLMYGGSGAGGATSNAGAGGSVTGAAAPQGGNEVQAGVMGMMQQAQIDLIRAQTNKTNVEAENEAGVNREQTIAQTGKVTAESIATALENEYRSTKSYENGMTGNQVRYQREAAELYNRVADTELKKLDLQQMPQELANETKRVILEGQKIAILGYEAKTHRQQMEIYKKLGQLELELKQSINNKNLDQNASQFKEGMSERRHEFGVNQTMRTVENIMQAVLPWFEPSETVRSSDWSESYDDGEGGYRREGGRTTTRSRGR